jgi:hypothetical protein
MAIAYPGQTPSMPTPPEDSPGVEPSVDGTPQDAGIPVRPEPTEEERVKALAKTQERTRARARREV